MEPNDLILGLLMLANVLALVAVTRLAATVRSLRERVTRLEEGGTTASPFGLGGGGRR